METINEHWADFMKDLPPGANENQLTAMRQAFASGALSGLALATRRLFGENTTTPELKALAAEILALGKP